MAEFVAWSIICLLLGLLIGYAAFNEPEQEPIEPAPVELYEPLPEEVELTTEPERRMVDDTISVITKLTTENKRLRELAFERNPTTTLALVLDSPLELVQRRIQASHLLQSEDDVRMGLLSLGAQGLSDLLDREQELLSNLWRAKKAREGRAGALDYEAHLHSVLRRFDYEETQRGVPGPLLNNLRQILLE